MRIFKQITAEGEIDQKSVEQDCRGLLTRLPIDMRLQQVRAFHQKASFYLDEFQVKNECAELESPRNKVQPHERSAQETLKKFLAGIRTHAAHDKFKKEMRKYPLPGLWVDYILKFTNHIMDEANRLLAATEPVGARETHRFCELYEVFQRARALYWSALIVNFKQDSRVETLFERLYPDLVSVKQSDPQPYIKEITQIIAAYFAEVDTDGEADPVERAKKQIGCSSPLVIQHDLVALLDDSHVDIDRYLGVQTSAAALMSQLGVLPSPTQSGVTAITQPVSPRSEGEHPHA
jgi:hypothetical protein